MGKANKVKGEVRDVNEMVDLIQTLKDVADNKFFTLSAQKYKFKRFGEAFTEFFRLATTTDVKHPMLHNDVPAVGIIVVTIEGSFLGQFNNKIMRRAMEEKDKYDQFKFMAVGGKSVTRLRDFTPDLKLFTNMESVGIYQTALAVKNYIVEEVMSGRLGKVVIIFSFPKSFEIQKPQVVQLLPCSDLLNQYSEESKVIEKVIEESDSDQVVEHLVNLWVTTKLFEIFMDTIIASASAQASFLDDSLDKMAKENKKVRMKYRKAKKSDIDKSLRETFAARLLSG